MSRFRDGYSARGATWSVVAGKRSHATGLSLELSGFVPPEDVARLLLAVEAAVEACPWEAAKEAYVDAQLAGGSEEAAWDAAIAAYGAAKEGA